MDWTQIKFRARLFVVLLALAPTGCFFGEVPVSPLVGTWSGPDNDRVTFSANAVVVTPDKGQPTTMSAAQCNGTYRLVYGRMQSEPLQRAFTAQADLRAKLKQLLVQPEYPVADVTCDHGGTTYVLLNERQVLAVYRDSGVGGLEQMSRL